MRVGNKFGRWTVLQILVGSKVEVICECGTTKIVRKQYVANGQSKSCGCLKLADLVETPISIGDRFDRLVVIQRLASEFGHKRAGVLCDCGELRIVREDGLRNGHHKSCGCFRKEIVVKRTRTNGATATRLYRNWLGLFERCKGKYKHKGIEVCEEWNNFAVFKTFVEQILGGKPTNSHSLDRIDNNKGYEPGNVRWASKKEQSNNKDNTPKITIDGQTKSISGWAEVSGLSYGLLRARWERGWEPSKLLSPVRRKK